MKTPFGFPREKLLTRFKSVSVTLEKERKLVKKITPLLVLIVP